MNRHSQLFYKILDLASQVEAETDLLLAKDYFAVAQSMAEATSHLLAAASRLHIELVAEAAAAREHIYDG